MPTATEIDELIAGTTQTWTTDYNGTGVAGYIVKSKTNSNQIFMPAAGYYYGTSLNNFGSSGSYWSSSQNTVHSDGVFLELYPGEVSRSFIGRYHGFSVRGVCE